MFCEESSWVSAVRAPSVINANFLIFTASFSSLSCPGPPVITPLIPRPMPPPFPTICTLAKAQFQLSFYSICGWDSCIWIRICICICGLHFFCPSRRLFRKSSGNCDSQANSASWWKLNRGLAIEIQVQGCSRSTVHWKRLYRVYSSVSPPL